jgi:hypothetical protein
MKITKNYIFKSLIHLAIEKENVHIKLLKNLKCSKFQMVLIYHLHGSLEFHKHLKPYYKFNG